MDTNRYLLRIGLKIGRTEDFVLTHQSKCCSKPKPPVQERIVQIDNKGFNQDVLVRKGMKSEAQVGRTDDGDFEAGFQIMFQKRKIKKYSAASNNVPVQAQDVS